MNIIYMLLSGILVTLILILLRMPDPLPSISQYKSLKTKQERIEFFQNIPMVKIRGSVDVFGEVSINNDDKNPVFVEFETPVSVEISR